MADELNKEIKEIKKEERKAIKELKKNPWIIVSAFLGIVIIVLLILNFSGITGKGISKDDAGEKLVSYLNSRTGGGVSFISAEDIGGVYEVVVLYQGDEIPVYMTKNGEYMISGLMPITAQVTQSTQQSTQQTGYSEEDLEKLKDFNNCLASKGVKIYGANWCGWTKKWVVETLGGFNIASSVYVECTENEELCSSEGVSGYPTTKINGEVYSGQRTIEAIAEVTGCTIPELTGTAASSSGGASDVASCS